MIGVHINKGDQTLEESIKSAFDDGWTCGQVFLWNPQSLKPVDYNPQKVKELLEKENKKIYVHSTYLVSPWGQKAYNKPLCIKQLKQQAEISPGSGVIFHLPNKPTLDFSKDLKFIIDHKPKDSRVLLENKAYKSDFSYADPIKINEMIETFIKEGIFMSDICLCIDTAHLFSAGQKISTAKDMKEWFSKLKYPKTIKLIHLNGNSSTTVQDIHQVPFSPKDLIWHNIKYEDSGFQIIIEWTKANKVDCIIECHYQDSDQHKLALQLLKNINKKD